MFVSHNFIINELEAAFFSVQYLKPQVMFFLEHSVNISQRCQNSSFPFIFQDFPRKTSPRKIKSPTLGHSKTIIAMGESSQVIIV